MRHPLQTLLVIQTPTKSASGFDCTTTRQNAHGTDVVVCYRWHPWWRKTVRVVRTLSRGSESVVGIFIEIDGRPDHREIPSWMLDSAACSSMIVADDPVVSSESLHALQDLLRCAARVVVGTNAQDQHFTPKGGNVDAESPPPRSSCSTRSLSPSNSRAPQIAGSAVGGEETLAPSLGEVTDGSSAQTSLGPKRKEGSR